MKIDRKIKTTAFLTIIPEKTTQHLLLNVKIKFMFYYDCMRDAKINLLNVFYIITTAVYSTRRWSNDFDI